MEDDIESGLSGGIAVVTVYIDADYRCYRTEEDGRRPIITDFFVGREEEIENYRLIPNGESWKREDGTIFKGEMIAPDVPIA